MKKRILSLFLIIMMGASFLSNHFAISFYDLNRNHWAYATIISLAESGVINGYPDGSYQPEKTVTRAEYLKLIMTALYGGNDSFETSELRKVHWAFPYVWEARKCGYIEENYIVHTSDIDRAITRLEMAKILASICSANQISAATSNYQAPSFSDTKNLSATARNAISVVAKNAFIKGYPDGTFGPDKIMSRAECATIIERFMNAL